MAAINFYSNILGYSHNLKISGSGLGFYGANGFNNSVAVGAFQSTNYITDPNSAIQGAQVNCVKFRHASSGEVAGGVVLNVKNIPNYQSTIMIALTNDTAVRAENATVYIYDRVNKNNSPSGVICKVYETIHTSENQAVTGSGATEWTTCAGSGTTLTLSNSPGLSGAYAGNGTDSTVSSLENDWYLNLSASPSVIGARPFGLWFELEYI